MYVNIVKYSAAICWLFLCFTATAKCVLVSNIQGYSPRSQTLKLDEFEWLAFENGKVLATGTGQAKKYRSCKKIDGNGQFLLPGIIDAHGHILGLGSQLLRVDLRGASSEQAAAERVRTFAKSTKSATWIQGRGWNQVLWDTKRFPTKASLDAIKVNKPILLQRVDGHAAWVNSQALALAGINSHTADPAGGKIIRDEKGQPTGVLIDNAISLVESKIPPASQSDMETAFVAAFNHLLSLGITSVHDAGIEQPEIDYYVGQSRLGQLPLRVYGMLSGSSPNLMSWLSKGVIQDDKDFLSIQSVKLYSDGALGSRGAAMLAPYSDDAHNKGLLLTDPKQLNFLVEAIIANGFQANIHAIGDRGNRLVLDAFSNAYKKVGGKELRNRIEHAQVVAPEDIPRFKELEIIASMQPVHATSDKNMAGDRIGHERLKGAYAWQRFLKQGTVIASGSDFPVELANPFHGLHAAITRQDHDNLPDEGWLPKEKMTPVQALRSFTVDAAYAAHQESLIGSLEPGKWADFILVDRDIIKGDSKTVWLTLVEETWVAGELKYKRKI